MFARRLWPILLAACASTHGPGEPLARRGDEIVACGQLFHTGTRVILWMDPGGYDAYRPHRHLQPDEPLPRDGDEVPRYGTFRRNLPPAIEERVKREGWRLGDLKTVVTRIVIHYDAAGSSKRCFEVLHDIRGLSAHFLLDLDGTVYQTLDVKERAWHAGKANDFSVGIEIANLGAYADPAKLPGRPVRGRIRGRTYYQLPYTDAQYEALGKLLKTLCLVLEVPPDRTGIIGHDEITTAKIDPGPAFDWDYVISLLRGR